jgi:ABC-type Fe3+/spermidine/putrescine transport system ATPase subunit
MHGASRGEGRRIAETNLERVEMSGFGRRLPAQLSGGQQQRVALARALAAQPDCLLLDEPLSNLDARLRLHMRDELRRLVKSTRTTAVYVTHDQKEALSMADRIAVMNEGRIVQIGTAEEVYGWPATRFVADFLGEANFIDGHMVEQGPPVRIETPVGTILAEKADGVSAGQTVTCCVRPERISIDPPGAPGAEAPALAATVENSSYLGEMRQYICRLADETRWKVLVLASSSPALADGSSVNLRVDRAAILPAE